MSYTIKTNIKVFDVKINGSFNEVLNKKMFAKESVYESAFNALVQSGKRITKEIKASMPMQGSGRIYKYRGVVKVASAPGEYLVNRTGSLRASVKNKVNNPLSITFSSKFYGGIWALHNEKQRRDFMISNIDKNKNNIAETINKRYDSILAFKYNMK